MKKLSIKMPTLFLRISTKPTKLFLQSIVNLLKTYKVLLAMLFNTIIKLEY